MPAIPLGIRRGQVRLVSFQRHWRASFLRERGRILRALGSLKADVQHVGSTAIPGIPAKPLLDITIGLKSQRDMHTALTRLERAGYWHNSHGDLPDRLLLVGNRTAWRTKHLSLVVVGSLTWRNHVLFRDFLLRHPKAAARYAALKRKLAHCFTDDRDKYTASKSVFVESILCLAAKARGKD